MPSSYFVLHQKFRIIVKDIKISIFSMPEKIYCKLGIFFANNY